MNDTDDIYDTVSVEPDMLNLLNLFTIIHNRKNRKNTNLLDGVNPRVPNDTSEIQEEFNSILVEHLHMNNENSNNTLVYKFDSDIDNDNDNDNETSGSGKYKYYVLKIGDKSVCYSKSKLALLICGSSLMKESNNYGKDFDLIELK
jgi:hypothetical protein